ncbi:MAG: hypothetical protein K0R94_416 [Burkholderiales bacterium]|nr:hypothetical protein [Burkholderiales bacterium]
MGCFDDKILFKIYQRDIIFIKFYIKNMIKNPIIVFKKVKNINIKVKRNLDIILTVPMQTRRQTIDTIIIKRQEWINKQLEYFKQRQTPVKQYESGEVFKFLGQTYTLKIINSAQNTVKLNNDCLELSISDNFASIDKKALLIDKWYKDQALHYFMPILEKYRQIIGKTINRVVIRHMKTRWGSCNPKKAYINLNLELIKKPVTAIEYVVLHELAHLTHYNHDSNFYNYMSLYMPDWKSRKKLLEL